MSDVEAGEKGEYLSPAFIEIVEPGPDMKAVFAGYALKIGKKSKCEI